MREPKDISQSTAKGRATCRFIRPIEHSFELLLHVGEIDGAITIRRRAKMTAAAAAIAIVTAAAAAAAEDDDDDDFPFLSPQS